jgi:23S rRNA (uracil1939-C5)-methyltransferase
VAVNGKVIHGDPTLRLASTNAQLRASPLSFYQVNLEVNRQLVRTAQQWVREQQPERLLDVYCGIGNLSCGLWAEVPTVGIENEGQAIEDCRATAMELGVQANLTTHACAAQQFDFSGEAFDVALLDPPRSGTDGVLDRILRNRPRALIYVSCNLAGAVSDLRMAQAKGYAITQVKCFDMFPETHHLETILLLQRS